MAVGATRSFPGYHLACQPHFVGLPKMTESYNEEERIGGGVLVRELKGLGLWTVMGDRRHLDQMEEDDRGELLLARNFVGSRPTLLVFPCFAHLAAIWRR